MLKRTAKAPRMAEEVSAGRHACLMTRAIDRLSAEADLERLLGDLLLLIVEGMGAVGATLWSSTAEQVARFHFEVLDGRVLGAADSSHPMARPRTESQTDLFPAPRLPDAPPLSCALDDPHCPPSIRAYLRPFGVRTLINIPMRLGPETPAWISLSMREPYSAALEGRMGFAIAIASLATLAAKRDYFANAVRKEERARLAEELHDTVAQDLAALHLLFENVRFDLAGGRLDAVDARLERALGITINALESTRRSIRSQRAADPDAATLAVAFRTSIEHLRTGSDTRVTHDIEESVNVDEFARHELVRILQESLTNALRHAKALRVHVMWRALPGYAALIVADDGIGFDTAAPAGSGFGLGVLRRRTARIGASLRIHSVPGHGTTVSVYYPIETTSRRLSVPAVFAR